MPTQLQADSVDHNKVSTTRVYVQSEFFSEVKLVEVDELSTVEALKDIIFELLLPGVHRQDVLLSLEDNDDEGLKASDIHLLKHERSIRLHLHRCKHVEVQIRYTSEVLTHQFRPSATIGRVRLWAGHKLGMKPEDIAEHVLQISGSEEQPDVDVHVGTLAKCPNCSVTFDLVPAHRING